MNKRLSIMCTTSFLMLSSFMMTQPIAVCAADNVSQEVVESAESAVGDELQYIINTDTKKSEETPCQVTASFKIPPGFNLNAYMDIMNDDGTIYKILTADKNGYSDFAFVKAGHYVVLEYGVVNDTVSEYSFTIENDNFTSDVSENSVITLKATLDNYDEIAQIISDRTAENTPVSESGTDENEDTVSANEVDYVIDEVFPTYYDDITINSSGFLYYDTVSNSKSCVAQVYGNATGTYDLYFEVIKGGVVGEAEFNISLDGGKTFIGTDISANDYSFASRGLNITFKTEKDTDELEVGDTFTASVLETFAVNSSYFDYAPNLIITGHPAKKYKVIVTVISTGKNGVAKYSLSLDNGVTTKCIDTIPENGIVTYGELTYCFSDSEFTKGTIFTSSVSSNIHTISYIPLYILLCVAAVVGIIFYIWLSLQKEKPMHYCIRTWNDRQDKSKYE